MRPGCQDCHSGLLHWDTAPEGFFFTGKTARQLCIQFKKFEPTPLAFVRHIYNDKGGTAFAETAFKGDRALNTIGEDMVEEATGRPFEALRPPMTHGEFVQAGSDWANAVGERGWKATPDCGCGPKKSAWTGTVTGVWNLDMGGKLHVVEKTTANVRFELDTSFGLGPDLYWKSVSGELEWSTEITGECRATASGMLPIDQGGDDNPLAMLSLQTELGGGPRYMVSVGPWRDEYQPRFRVRCPTASFPGVLYGLGSFGIILSRASSRRTARRSGEGLRQPTPPAPTPGPGISSWNSSRRMSRPDAGAGFDRLAADLAER